MKALVKTKKGKGFLEVKSVADPVKGDNDVLLRINAAGICGTDLHIQEDRFHYVPPVILGHEFSGGGQGSTGAHQS
jgi:L-iditol 2-dehydrogenase